MRVGRVEVAITELRSSYYMRKGCGLGQSVEEMLKYGVSTGERLEADKEVTKTRKCHHSNLVLAVIGFAFN